MDDYHCISLITRSETEYLVRPTIFLHLRIKFHFSLHSTHQYYTTHDAHSLGQVRTFNCEGSSDVILRGEFSYEKAGEAVEMAFGDRLPVNDRWYLAWKAWEIVGERFGQSQALPRCTILDIDIKMWIAHRYVSAVAGHDGSACMVPAASSSLGMLAMRDGVGAEEERVCCICLERIGSGGGTLRMPCSHVFHGGCIELWLRMSHHCPVCRYQLPTD